VDGFRFEYQNATDYDMTGVGPWSAQVLLSSAKVLPSAELLLQRGGEVPLGVLDGTDGNSD